MSDSVVYAIQHVSGKQYVGSTARWKRRRAEHLGSLRSGRHCNKHLQAAWAKHGEAEFSFVVLEVVPDAEDLLRREQHWMDHLRAVEDGYNLCVEAGSRRGVPHSQEHRARISEAKQGHRHSDETKAHIRAARAAQTMRPEAMAKTHAANRGKPRSADTRAKIAASHAGKKLSEATKAKLVAANLGRKDSPETRARKSAAATAWRAKRRAQEQGIADADD